MASSKIPPIPLPSINSGLEFGILTGKSPGYPYGQRDRTTPDKWRYDIALPGNCFSPLTVSIPGSQDALPEITDEMITDACAALRPILVRFIDCQVRIYDIEGLKMSAKASSVELVKPSK